MKTITLKGLTYEIDSDSYDGDMLLLNEAQDIRIRNGYTMLRRQCEDRFAYEYDEHEVRYQMDLNLLDFIDDNYSEGVVEIHNTDDSATDEVLAVVSKQRLEKLKWSVALMHEKIGGGDPDLIWWANRVEGALKVQSDPSFLPY